MSNEMVPRESPTTKEVSCGWIINKLDEAAEYHLKNYGVGLGGY